MVRNKHSCQSPHVVYQTGSTKETLKVVMKFHESGIH